MVPCMDQDFLFQVIKSHLLFLMILGGSGEGEVTSSKETGSCNQGHSLKTGSGSQYSSTGQSSGGIKTSHAHKDTTHLHILKEQGQFHPSVSKAPNHKAEELEMESI